jgi:hypothetical protein
VRRVIQLRAVMAILLLLPGTLWAQVPGPEEDSPNVALAQARGLYQSLNYDACLERLALARKTATSRTEKADIELYTGLCSYGLNREEKAAEHFALARQLNPNLTLPKHSSPKIRSLFDRVEPQVHLAPEPPATLFLPPPPDPKAEARKSEKRKWAVIFLGVAAGALGAGAAMGSRARTFETLSNDPSLIYQDQIQRAGQDAYLYAAAANSAYTLAVSAVLIAGLLKLTEAAP